MQKEMSSSTVSHADTCNSQDLGQTRTRKLKTNPGLPWGWQAAKCLDHHLLSPGCTLAKRVEVGLKPGHSGWNADAPSSSCARAHPYEIFVGI